MKQIYELSSIKMIKAVFNKAFFIKVAIEEDVHVSTTANNQKFNNSEFQRRKHPMNNQSFDLQREPMKATLRPMIQLLPLLIGSDSRR